MNVNGRLRFSCLWALLSRFDLYGGAGKPFSVWMYHFTDINEVVKVSSMRGNFSPRIIKAIEKKAQRGEIEPFRCYKNAVVTAELLASSGVSGIRVVDGTYAMPSLGTDTHRFIQHTRADGTVRYYDVTMEFFDPVTFSVRDEFVEYLAVRAFDMAEIERFSMDCSLDVAEVCKQYSLNVNATKPTYHSTLNESVYNSIPPVAASYIDQDGTFVSLAEAASERGENLDQTIRGRLRAA